MGLYDVDLRMLAALEKSLCFEILHGWLRVQQAWGTMSTVPEALKRLKGDADAKIKALDMLNKARTARLSLFVDACVRRCQI